MTHLRPRPAIASLALLAVTSLTLTAVPALAADVVVTTEGELTGALSSATAGTTVRLGADFSVTAASLEIPTDLTLDLAGHDLTTANITVNPAKTLTVQDTGSGGSVIAVAVDVPSNDDAAALAGITITDAALVVNSGTVDATGARRGDDGSDAAGIGGNGHEPMYDLLLDVADVPVTGGSLTVNGGTVSATGTGTGAGIGGGNFGSGGTVTITGGTVTTTSDSAGIGGGRGGSGGAVTVTGGTVNATGAASGIGAGIPGDSFETHLDEAGRAGTVTVSGGTVTATASYGPGIGGTGELYRFSGGGGTVDITGGTVVATTDGSGAAGIGGGSRSRGLDVTIGANADVTAEAGPADNGAYGSAVGQGAGAKYDPSTDTSSPFPFGSLTVAGTLTLPSGSALRLPGDATTTIAATGVLTGTGQVRGFDAMEGVIPANAGTVVNHGTIKATVTVVDAATTSGDLGVTVTDHNHPLTVDANGGTLTAPAAPARLYAASLGDAGAALPGATRAGFALLGWNTAATGTGTPFTASTTVTGPTTLYARWGVAPSVTTQPTNVTVTAGQTATFTAAASGDPAPTVQWQSQTGSGGWSDLAGATTANLAVTGTTTAQTGTSYRAVFTSAAGTATTGAATLTVQAPLTLPSAPTKLKLTAKPSRKRVTKIKVTWRAPDLTGGTTITGYRVQWSTDGGKHWKTREVSGAKLVLKNLKAGRVYAVRVAAVNSVGAGDYTKPKKVTVARPR